jgi:SnoaL-like domain
MSQENVEVVLEGIRRFEASDFEGVSRRWHPDSWITGPEGWPERGPFEGRDAVLGQFRRLAADWGEHRVSEIQVVADRADWVVVTFRWEVRGERSGARLRRTSQPPTGSGRERSAKRISTGPLRTPRSRRAAGVGD